jgi:phosphopantothenoylcysteine decarboxylase/phosphopantothenate--cysteine ligase
MTDNAQRFVTAQTFQACRIARCAPALWDETAEAAMGHLELARWAQR